MGRFCLLETSELYEDTVSENGQVPFAFDVIDKSVFNQLLCLSYYNEPVNTNNYINYYLHDKGSCCKFEAGKTAGPLFVLRICVNTL